MGWINLVLDCLHVHVIASMSGSQHTAPRGESVSNNSVDFFTDFPPRWTEFFPLEMCPQKSPCPLTQCYEIYFDILSLSDRASSW